MSPQGLTNVADIIGRDGRNAAGMSFARGVDPTKPRLVATNGGSLGELTLASGTWAHGTRQVVIDRHTAAVQHFKVGDRIVISTLGTQPPSSSPARCATSARSFPPPEPRRLGHRVAQMLLHRRGRFDVMSIQAERGTSRVELVRAIEPLLSADLQVKSLDRRVDEAADDWERTIASIRAFLLVFGVIALLIGAFVIFNTLSITVAQRTRELATLRTSARRAGRSCARS